MVRGDRCKSVPYNHFKALLFIPSSQKGTNYWKSLFLPTCFVTIEKVSNFTAQIFLILISIPLDIATLPVRFICAPIKAIFDTNSENETHPLEHYLSGVACSCDNQQQKQLINNAIKTGKLWIEIDSSDVQLDNISESSKAFVYKSINESITKTRFLCITKEMPINHKKETTKFYKYNWSMFTRSKEWTKSLVGKTENTMECSGF